MANTFDRSGQRCSRDINNYDRQRDKHNFSSLSENLTHDEDRWRTSTMDAFVIREFGKSQTIGRRRDLVKRIINERVMQKLQIPEEIANDGFNPSEYNDQFGDSKFTPFMDKIDTDESKLTKYPLYACNNQTFYKDQVERGTLKLRSEILNLNEPFRKNCVFTTSPEYALREPTGGY